MPQPEWLIFNRETNLHSNLVMGHLLVLQMSPDLRNFKPPHVLYRFGRAVYRIVDGIFQRSLGRTDDFNLFINVITHDGLWVDGYSLFDFSTLPINHHPCKPNTESLPSPFP